MKIGFIQDIHGNIEALDEVLKSLTSVHKVDYIFCMGDLINYGPNPNEVIQRIYNHNINFILGDEEYALFYPNLFYPNMSELAKNCMNWTKSVLSTECYNFLKRNEFNANGGDNRCIYGEDFMGVHCSAFDITSKAQYGVFLDSDELARDNISLLISNEKRVMFFGHTHIPMIYAYNEYTGKMISVQPNKNYTRIKFLPKHYYLINFGSVSFSRDLTTLASFGVLDVDNSIFEIHRIPYNIGLSLEKLEKIQAPPKVLGWLAHGGITIKD